MSRSVLLQLSRDSIEEVFQAERSINKQALLRQHPLLNENIPTTVKIFVDNELRGSYKSDESKSLIEEIIINSKRAAFEDISFTPISTSEYLHCEIELTLQTQEGVISERDTSILSISTN